MMQTERRGHDAYGRTARGDAHPPSEAEVRWSLAMGRHKDALGRRLSLTQPRYCADGQPRENTRDNGLDLAVDTLVRNAPYLPPVVLDAVAHSKPLEVPDKVPEHVRSAAARIACSCLRARSCGHAPREKQYPMSADEWRDATALAERLITRSAHLLR